MSKQFLIAIAAIVVILGGIVFVSNHNKQNSLPGSSGTPTHHVEGTSPEGVTLIEYGDYECPVCGSYFPVVKQVAAKYSDKIIFQFRNLPLTSIHPNAFAGARAAEAAGLQGQYWEMHDLLYENQDPTGQSGWVASRDPLNYFEQYADQLKLNKSQFDNDYASEQVNNAINADLDAFAKTGDEMATPTFYLDGKKVGNAQLVDSTGEPSLDAFSKVLDTEIAKKAPKQ